jgi:hypothetical protein
VVVDFDVVVGAVLDLADDLCLSLDPPDEPADAGDSVVGVVWVGNDAGIRVAVDRLFFGRLGESWGQLDSR